MAALNSDIRKAILSNQAYWNYLISPELQEDTRWTIDINGNLCFQGRIFVPETEDLRLRVLQAKHDHVLAGHPGQAKTLQLIRREYTWPNL